MKKSPALKTLNQSHRQQERPHSLSWGLRHLCLFSSLVLLSACSSPGEGPASTEDQEKRALVQDIKDEISIGRTMASKLLGTFGFFEKQPNADKYVQKMGQSLAKQFGRPELKYHFAILDSEDPNAFATPGGYIFVTRGLLRQLQDESELAGVLAHELVHVNHRHMYMKVRPKREVGTGETVSRILSRGAADIGKSLSAAVGAGLKTLLEEGLTHDNEFDADATALIYVSNLGYDATGLPRVLKRLSTIPDKTLISKTHPPFKQRIENIEKIIANEKLSTQLKLKVAVTDRRFKNSIKGL